MKKRKSHLFSILTFPVLLYLTWVSLFFSPIYQGKDIENEFNDYFKTYILSNHEHRSEERIRHLISTLNLRLRHSPDEPLAKHIWVGMFSGNENIALISGSIHFNYLIKNDISSSPSVILIIIIFSALLLVTISTVCHNTLTYALRLHRFPTENYIKYTFQYFKDLGIKSSEIGKKDEEQVRLKGVIRVLFAFVPIWSIGLLIGYFQGDYNNYIQSHIVSQHLLIIIHLFCTCAGSIIILTINHIILFLFMRFNIDIVTNFLDDIICAILSIFISVWIFNNSLGTTLTVALFCMIYTLQQNNDSRGENLKKYKLSALAAIAYANLGLNYHNRKNILNSIKMYQQSIKIYNEIEQENDSAPVYASLGKAYFDFGNLEIAKDNFMKAISLYKNRPYSSNEIESINVLLNRIKELSQDSKSIERALI